MGMSYSTCFASNSGFGLYVKNIDLSQSPSMLEQRRVECFQLVPGKPETGTAFQRVKPQHPQAAVVYLYRPDSRWNRQEVVAPNFF